MPVNVPTMAEDFREVLSQVGSLSGTVSDLSKHMEDMDAEHKDLQGQLDNLRYRVTSLENKQEPAPTIKYTLNTDTKVLNVGTQLVIEYEILNAEYPVSIIVNNESFRGELKDTIPINSNIDDTKTIVIKADNVELFNETFHWILPPPPPPPPPVDPVIELNASAFLVNVGEDITLTWKITNVTNSTAQLWLDNSRVADILLEGSQVLRSATPLKRIVGIGIDNKPPTKNLILEWEAIPIPPPPPPPPPPPITNAPWKVDLQVVNPPTQVEANSFFNLRMICTLLDGPNILNAGSSDYTSMWNVHVRSHDAYLWGIPAMFFHKPVVNDPNHFLVGQSRTFDGPGYLFRAPDLPPGVKSQKFRFRFQCAWDTTYFLKMDFNKEPNRGWFGPMVDIEIEVVASTVPAQPLPYDPITDNTIDLHKDFRFVGVWRPDPMGVEGRGFGAEFGSVNVGTILDGKGNRVERYFVHVGGRRQEGLCILTMPEPTLITKRPANRTEFNNIAVAWKSAWLGRFSDIIPFYATDPVVVSGEWDDENQIHWFCVQDSYGNFPRWDDPGGNTLFGVKVDTANRKMIPIGSWHINHLQYKGFWWGPDLVSQAIADEHFGGKRMFLSNGGFATQTQNGSLGPCFGMIDPPTSPADKIVPKTLLQYFYTGDGPNQAYFKRRGNYNLYSHPYGRNPISKEVGYFGPGDTVLSYCAFQCKDKKGGVICFARESKGPKYYYYSYVGEPLGSDIVSYTWNFDQVKKLVNRDNEAIPSTDVFPCKRSYGTTPFPGYVGGYPVDATFHTHQDGRERLYIWCQYAYNEANGSEPLCYVLERK